MFRMNFLVICLCLIMNRPYQFYYFVPLISFWFLIMYLTLSGIPQVTAQSCEGNIFGTKSHLTILFLRS